MEAHKTDMNREVKEDTSSESVLPRSKEHGTDGSNEGTTSSRTEAV
jgi:hypothetical protein